jgi:cytochrome c oxidase cbb3-type subunit 3/ubiquinol-cytochrome c reductase cytochrome c subunit
VAVVASVVLLAGCDWLPGRPEEADRPLRPSEVRDFARLWGENCAGCHGADGTLGPAAPLANPTYLAWVDDSTLEHVIAEGVPGTGMPAFAQHAGGWLVDEQINDLVRQMRTRWAKPLQGAAPPPFAGGGIGDLGRGRSVWTQRCGSCHDPDGTGSPRGGSVIDPAYLALVSDQALRTAVVAGRPDLGMPDWRGGASATPLTAQEVVDVVAWMASHRGGGA